MRPAVAALLFDEPYYIEINEARWAMARQSSSACALSCRVA